MFNKLKNKIKLKLIQWLEIDRLDKELNSANYKIIQNENEINYNSQAINTIHTTLENIVHIGTDVRPNDNKYEHSWAVICIEGKMNIVKFVDLIGNDAREILRFLKQFEGGRHCIDAPISPMFYENFFKF